MTAREYCRIPGVAWICRTVHCIPVDRDGRDIKPARAALEELRQGNQVGIFPEGGINTGEGLREGDTGIAWLALHARVPVYPVYLQGSPRDTVMVRPFYTLSRVRVIYGEPIDLSAYQDQRKTRALLTEVTDLLMRRLAALGGERYVKDVRPRTGEPVLDFHHSIRPTG